MVALEFLFVVFVCQFCKINSHTVPCIEMNNAHSNINIRERASEREEKGREKKTRNVRDETMG